MMRMRQLILAAVAAAALAAALVPARGQMFQELNYFSSCYWDDNTGWHCPDGAGPQCTLIQAKDGNFYGTTTSDGQWGCGTVFKMTPEGALTALASFDGTNGCFPYGALLQASDGNFYGTTVGSAYGQGILFRVTPEGKITPLVGFGGSSDPVGDLAQGPDGLLYGVTQTGGPAGGNGTIFRTSLDGAFELLAVLYPGPGPYYPTGGLLLASDGNFYGPCGGLHGSIYRLTTNGVVSTVAVFGGGPGEAAWPFGKLVEAEDGNFYGVAGGASARFTSSLRVGH